MKRKLFFPLLISLLIIPLVFTGCQLLGGGNESESNPSNTTPIGRLETRVVAVEGIVGGWANNPPWITEASFADYAKLTDIPAPPDLSGYVTKAQYDELLARVEALEGNGEDGTPPSGVVTAVLADAPVDFQSGSTPTVKVFPVKITNGTDAHQLVSFNITLRCFSTDYTATVTALTSMTINGVEVWDAVPVVDFGDCRAIYFIWVGTEPIPVEPSKERVVYVSLNGFATSGWEVWEVTLADIVAKKL